MTSEDLTREQAEALKAEFSRMLRYLNRLSERMNRRRFPPNDPLVVRTREAYNAIHALNVEVHYLSVEHGVGRAVRKRRQDGG